jgi:hypothetical protein
MPIRGQWLPTWTAKVLEWGLYSQHNLLRRFGRSTERLPDCGAFQMPEWCLQTDAERMPESQHVPFDRASALPGEQRMREKHGRLHARSLCW